MQGGFELVRDIQDNWPDAAVKVVAVTADAFDDTRDKCLEAGFQGWSYALLCHPISC